MILLPALESIGLRISWWAGGLPVPVRPTPPYGPLNSKPLARPARPRPASARRSRAGEVEAPSSVITPPLPLVILPFTPPPAAVPRSLGSSRPHPPPHTPKPASPKHAYIHPPTHLTYPNMTFGGGTGAVVSCPRAVSVPPWGRPEPSSGRPWAVLAVLGPSWGRLEAALWPLWGCPGPCRDRPVLGLY